MKEIRLAYYSRPSAEFAFPQVDSILSASERNNLRFGITGQLAMTRHHFIQVLEGSREAVSKLYARINNDPRHEDVIIAGCEDINERIFDSWSMHFISAQALTPELSMKLVGAPRITPALLTFDQIVRLMHSISKDTEIDKLSREALATAANSEDFFDIVC